MVTEVKRDGYQPIEYAEVSAPALKLLGVRGLKNLGGRIQEEYLAALRSWSVEVKHYLEMRDDATIGTLLDAIKLPLLAADIEAIAASEDGVDVKAADFLRANLFGMTGQSWRAHMTDALECLDFGYFVGEMVLEKREDGRLWLRNIDPRGQETLEQWQFDVDDPDKAVAYIQRDPDTGKLLTVPLEKCVHVTWQGRKGNPQGKSVLRAVYRPWRFCKDMENLEGIGVERDVGGMPVLELPEGYVDTGASETSDLGKIKAALKALRIDEASYMIIPPGSTLTAYGSVAKAYDIGAIIERKQKEILGRFFAQFLKLGMAEVGTQALVKGSQDFFMLALISIEQTILEAWNGQLVPYLFKYNDFGVKQLPQITWANPGQVDLKAWVDAYAAGVNAKLVTPVREDEIKFRALADMPDLPEGEGEGERLIERAPEAGLFPE